MDRILLVRHGQAAAPDDVDPALSDVGVRQAEALAARLRGEDVDELWHGPRCRARQSAEILAQGIGRDPRPTSLLEDRTPYPSADRWDDYPRHRWERLQQVPVQERDEDAAALGRAWEQLSAAGERGTLLAVTHAFVVGTFVSAALGAPPAAWMQLPVAAASLTELRIRPTGEWSVLAVSDVGHLVDL